MKVEPIARAVESVAAETPIGEGDVDAVMHRGRRRRSRRRIRAATAALVLAVAAASAALVVPGQDSTVDVQIGVADDQGPAIGEEWVDWEPTVEIQTMVERDGTFVGLRTHAGDATSISTEIWSSSDAVQWDLASTVTDRIGLSVAADDSGFFALLYEPEGAVEVHHSSNGAIWTLDARLDFPASVGDPSQRGSARGWIVSGPAGPLAVVGVGPIHPDGSASEAVTMWSREAPGEWIRFESDLVERSTDKLPPDLAREHVLVDGVAGNRHGYLVLTSSLGVNPPSFVWASTNGADWKAVSLPIDLRQDGIDSVLPQHGLASDDHFLLSTRTGDELFMSGPDLSFTEVDPPHPGSTPVRYAARGPHVVALASSLPSLTLETETLRITIDDGTLVVTDTATGDMLHRLEPGAYRIDMTAGYRVTNAATGDTVIELDQDQAQAALERAGGPPNPDDSTQRLWYLAEGEWNELPTPEQTDQSTLAWVVGDLVFLDGATSIFVRQLPR